MCFGQRLVAESRHVHQQQSIIILGAVGYGGPTFSGHIEPTKGGFVDEVLLLYILTYTYLVARRFCKYAWQQKTVYGLCNTNIYEVELVTFPASLSDRPQLTLLAGDLQHYAVVPEFSEELYSYVAV